MTVETETIKINTTPDGGILDITGRIAELVASADIKNGIVVVFCPGSTGAVSTMEYEPGLAKDIPAALERIAPCNVDYEHHKTWNDDNGRSHVKAAIIGPSLTVPFMNKKLMLGAWQQIVFIELDTKARTRNVIVQIIGE